MQPNNQVKPDFKRGDLKENVSEKRHTYKRLQQKATLEIWISRITDSSLLRKRKT